MLEMDLFWALNQHFLNFSVNLLIQIIDIDEMLKVTVLDLYCTQNGEWINFDNSRKILIGSARMFYEFSSLFSFICNSIFSGLFCYIFLDFSLKVRVQLMHESGRTHFLRKTLIMDKIWVQNQLFPNSGCLLFLKLHLVMGSKK